MAVIVFPGTWSDRDFLHVAGVLGWQARAVWHAETELGEVDAVVLPGGFAHGDYLRTGAIARFSPVMAAVGAFADAGGPVIGSCNGFQILCEAGMLPGALLRNDHLEFRCDWQWLRVERPIGPWLAADELAPGDVVRHADLAWRGPLLRRRRHARRAGARGTRGPALRGVVRAR